MKKCLPTFYIKLRRTPQGSAPLQVAFYLLYLFHYHIVYEEALYSSVCVTDIVV